MYRNLNVDVENAFLVNKNHKEGKFTPDRNPIHYSYSQICKYNYAILYGSHCAKILLPEIYKIEMTGYLDSIKNKNMSAKKNESLTRKKPNLLALSYIGSYAS